MLLKRQRILLKTDSNQYTHVSSLLYTRVQGVLKYNAPILGQEWGSIAIITHQLKMIFTFYTENNELIGFFSSDDHSRVRLKKDESGKSDYINANYIDVRSQLLIHILSVNLNQLCLMFLIKPCFFFTGQSVEEPAYYIACQGIYMYTLIIIHLTE